MELGDLSAEVLAEAMPDRLLRTYPALLSTEADAQAWARAGAPAGALVVANYQVSPRGRAGLPWTTQPGIGLGFSLVLRPALPAVREGWVYPAAISGLAEALGDDTTIVWPDEVRREGKRVGALGASVELGPGEVQWAVVTVLVPDAAPPRAALLAKIVAALEASMEAPARSVLDEHLSRFETLGRRVQALMIPMGPAGPRVEGTAVDVLTDGSLVVATDRGRRVAVRPQNLGLLNELSDEPDQDQPERGGLAGTT